MSQRRIARVASMIREVVSEAILTELRDPRIRNVTVLGAEVSPDLRYATVRVSVRGDAREAALTMHGLRSARGYLQAKVAEFVRTRYTPELRFVLDEGLHKSAEVTRILDEIHQAEHHDTPESSERDAPESLARPLDDLTELSPKQLNESIEGEESD